MVSIIVASPASPAAPNVTFEMCIRIEKEVMTVMMTVRVLVMKDDDDDSNGQ